jgi:hypothetical protein
MGIPIGALCGMHYNLYGQWNVLAQSLIGFLVVNLVICIWELALFYRFDEVERAHERRLKNGFYKNSAEGAAVRSREPLIIFKDIPLRDLCSLRIWAHVWADYARYDIAYTDKSTFSYNIDVGNGHSTIVSSILLLASIIRPIWSPKVTGLIGALLLYQKCYGTIIYLFAYINNKRYVASTWNEIFFCVICTNILWIVFPVIGFAACVDMIMSESFAMIQ